MEIPILTILRHSIPFVTAYLIAYIFYRYKLNPRLRWYQKGNVVHDQAKIFCLVWSFVIWFSYEAITLSEITFAFK